MDEDQNPGKNEEPGVRLDHFLPSGWKNSQPGSLFGEMSEDALKHVVCGPDQELHPGVNDA
jgi:hypothetical protein